MVMDMVFIQLAKNVISCSDQVNGCIYINHTHIRQGAGLTISSWSGFSVSPKDTSMCGHEDRTVMSGWPVLPHEPQPAPFKCFLCFWSKRSGWTWGWNDTLRWERAQRLTVALNGGDDCQGRWNGPIEHTMPKAEDTYGRTKEALTHLSPCSCGDGYFITAKFFVLLLRMKWSSPSVTSHQLAFSWPACKSAFSSSLRSSRTSGFLTCVSHKGIMVHLAPYMSA